VAAVVRLSPDELLMAAQHRLRTTAAWRVLDGFGGAVRAACRHATPRSADELAELVGRAQAEGLTVTLRGAGRSYGDASLNAQGLVIDTTHLDRLLRWEPETGVVEAEGGLSIEGLWRRTLEDGYWPAVVPGTMRPTLAGCVAMNIHGKNNFRAGSFGEHVLELELLTASGGRLRCSRTTRPEVFEAVVGGLGLLGAVTRVKLRLKPVQGGRLKVTPLVASGLDQALDLCESLLPTEDYVVGWMDCFAGGAQLGRTVVHAARFVDADEDPDGREWLRVERQGLPARIGGVPRGQLWKLMRLLTHDAGVALINSLKYQGSVLTAGESYLQSHAAFAFLLDYVPDWRRVYEPSGFIQYQVFVPENTARAALRDVLRLCQDAELCSYLGVLKRHRPDPFLLSHGLDGWSLALDLPVPRDGRKRLWALSERLTARVLEAGGTFYFAKDAVVSRADVARAYGARRLERFVALKRELDPTCVWTSDLWRRISPGTADNAEATQGT
jgi:FAD/FMN-containing dehydrogenase